MPLSLPEFDSRLAAVEERIGKALERSGRKRSEITLVAVTKKFSALRIREAYASGIRDFGENFVQEFAEKATQLEDLTDARFHLIGHLQSNKAQLACRLFQIIQTADSGKLIERLQKAAEEQNHSLEILLEVKLSEENSKTGAPSGAIGELLRAAERCGRIQVTGLMTMPPWSEDPEQSRPFFRALARLGREHGLPKLSMGMSGDFEVAIEEGATLIRVGTALFGARPKPITAASA